MIAKLRIRKWVWNFLWEYWVGLFSPLCGLCASKHISFSFVSFCFLVRDWYSWQWERPALFQLQDLHFCNDLFTLSSSCFRDSAVFPATWTMTGCVAGSRGTWGQALSPEVVLSYCLPTLPTFNIYWSWTIFFLPELTRATTFLHIAK